ncbi:MAG: SpoIID/LytB domain-containing protein [Bacteriovoracaceae bacterium]|nr:SpoIID/LytB domain-containing protein [Bacteriovoracaceae bacterium]
MLRTSFKLILAALLSLYAFTTVYGATFTPKIRVRIAKNISVVSISGMDLNRKFISDQSVKHYAGRKRIKFNCQNIDYKKYQKKGAIRLVSVNSDTGLVTFGEEKYSGKILITTSDDFKSCDVINEVDIESYISSLLAKEMNGTWPVEALKAQAVAARTYAIYKIRQRQFAKKRGRAKVYDIENSEKHQVGGHFFDATVNTLDAARGTRGQVLLTKAGNLTETFFHASCGGQTKTPDQVWSNIVEGYTSVKCPRCKKSDKQSYIKKITRKRFVSFLSWASKNKFIPFSKNIQRFVVAPDRLKNSKMRVYVDSKVYILEKSLLRRYFGRFVIPSNHFVISLEDDILVVIGKGHGHGVGMCQLGALQMARDGRTYNSILYHYFPNHVLKKIFK